MKGVKDFIELWKSNKGSSSLIIICTTITVILASALLSDVGYAAVERYRLTNSAELVAMAGVKALTKSGTDSSADRGYAVQAASDYAVKQVGDLNDLSIRISDNNREITVHMARPFEFLFLGVIGIKGRQLSANVTAKISSISAYKGIRPFVVEPHNFAYGETYTLSSAPAVGNGRAIGFAPVNLSDNYRADIVYGCRKQLKAGDGIYAFTWDENKAQESFEYFLGKSRQRLDSAGGSSAGDSSGLVVIPVVDKIDFSGSKAMNVLGFTAFQIEGSGISKGHITLTGKFVKYTVNSLTSDAAGDFGLSGIEMVH